MNKERRELINRMRQIADGLESGTIACAALVYTTPEGGVQYIYQGEGLQWLALMLLGARRVPLLIEEGLMGKVIGHQEISIGKGTGGIGRGSGSGTGATGGAAS